MDEWKIGARKGFPADLLGDVVDDLAKLLGQVRRRLFRQHFAHGTERHSQGQTFQVTDFGLKFVEPTCCLWGRRFSSLLFGMPVAVMRLRGRRHTLTAW